MGWLNCQPYFFEEIMAKEIEAKFSISLSEADNIVRKLMNLPGAKFKYNRDEINEFFDTKKHKLDSKDSILRLRTCRNGDKVTYFVTYKGPSKSSKIKIREEIETSIECAKQTRKLFKMLGFNLCFLFEKNRTTYSYRGCLIEIDRLPKLGYFCEIEGKSTKVIRSIKKKLGFEDAPLIRSGYGTLLRKVIKKSTKEVRF